MLLFRKFCIEHHYGKITKISWMSTDKTGRPIRNKNECIKENETRNRYTVSSCSIDVDTMQSVNRARTDGLPISNVHLAPTQLQHSSTKQSYFAGDK